MEFEQLFRDIEPSVKLDFLFSHLVKNEGLRNQFTEYCLQTSSKGCSPLDPKSVLKIIKEISEKFKSELEVLDFEDMDWSDYTPRHGSYIPEYEAAENLAEDQLSDIFNEWKETARNHIENGQILQATCILAGIYDACIIASIEGGDDIFGNLTDNLLQYHKQLMMEVTPEIETTVKSVDQCTWSVEAIFLNYRKRHDGMQDYLKHFEPLMISLTENGEIAERILSTLLNTAIDEVLMPGLVVKLYSFKSDPKDWVTKAEQFLYDDLDVAQKLLDYYWLHDPESFLQHGRKLFKLHSREFCDFFRERLFPLFNKEFFRDVLWFQTLRDRTTDLYEELREYLDDKDKQLFLEKIGYDDVFKVKVLEMEKQYGEILKLVQKEVQHTWNFPELITPILHIFPQEVFELIKVKTGYTIENEKGRHSYQRICLWLKLALQIKGKEVDTQNLIHSLYNRKPALPALKDEMRKAGVV